MGHSNAQIYVIQNISVSTALSYAHPCSNSPLNWHPSSAYNKFQEVRTRIPWPHIWITNKWPNRSESILWLRHPQITMYFSATLYWASNRSDPSLTYLVIRSCSSNLNAALAAKKYHHSITAFANLSLWSFFTIDEDDRPPVQWTSEKCAWVFEECRLQRSYFSSASLWINTDIDARNVWAVVRWPL